MEHLTPYSGGGGVEELVFCRDVRSTYLHMRDDSMRQKIEGFGEWEFMRLLGP